MKIKEVTGNIISFRKLLLALNFRGDVLRNCGAENCRETLKPKLSVVLGSVSA